MIRLNKPVCSPRRLLSVGNTVGTTTPTNPIRGPGPMSAGQSCLSRRAPDRSIRCADGQGQVSRQCLWPAGAKSARRRFDHAGSICLAVYYGDDQGGMMRNLNEHNITAETIRRIENTPDSRLQEIMTSLIEHLHDFAREVKLTEAEWIYGIRFLTRTGHLCTDIRQEFILLSDTLGLSQLVVAQNHSRPVGVTEQTVFGPFWVEGAPRMPHGADIANGAVGDPCHFRVTVADVQGRAVPDATIDIWHANSEGGYDVQDPGWTIEDTKMRAV